MFRLCQQGTDGDNLAYNIQDQKVVVSIEEENVFDKVDGNYDIEVFLCEGPTDTDTSRVFKIQGSKVYNRRCF